MPAEPSAASRSATAQFVLDRSRRAHHRSAVSPARPGRLFGCTKRIRAGEWVPASTEVHQVMGRTLGLVGFSSIGKKVAWRAQGLGIKVIAYDKYVDASVMEEAGVESVGLDELLQRSDFVSCHTLLNSKRAA
ncbi:MAG: NAD(P)-dependent oxidoreductase [Thermomicrobiales bacterium]